jgi:hypothetical protein
MSHIKLKQNYDIKRKYKHAEIPNPNPIDDDDEDYEYFISRLIKDKEYITFLTRKSIYNNLEELEFIIGIDSIEYDYLMTGFRGYN